MDFSTSSFIEGVPEAMRGRVALVDGKLHMSAELKGNLEMVTFVGMMRRRGIMSYEFHPPMEFDTNYANFASIAGQGENEVQQFA
ncbi:MAG: secretion system protein E, partial [Thermodesulfobacteriota bacterium]